VPYTTIKLSIGLIVAKGTKRDIEFMGHVKLRLTLINTFLSIYFTLFII